MNTHKPTNYSAVVINYEIPYNEQRCFILHFWGISNEKNKDDSYYVSYCCDCSFSSYCGIRLL